MNRKKRAKQILKFLSKNPLLTIREISDNSAGTRINHNVSRKALAELIHDNKIQKFLAHYYVIPTLDNEIPFLLKITSSDKILKPKFRRLSYENKSNRNFQYILESYIMLVHLQFKINKIEVKQSKKLSSHKQNIQEIRKDLITHLKSFKIKKHSSVEDFHNSLIKHIDDRYFRDSRHFYDLRIHSRTLKERAQMLSTYFKTNSIREIADQFGYESNKAPRKRIEEWFHENGNIQIDEIYAGLLTGEIKEKDISNLFFEWTAYIGLTTTEIDGRKLTEDELIRYRKTFRKKFKKLFKRDIASMVDIKAYGIS